MTTLQEKFWQSTFGKDYIKRNSLPPALLNRSYMQKYGVGRSAMNKKFLRNIKIGNVLEVGSNVGNQLKLLQVLGFKELYGLEINHQASVLARRSLPEVNIVEGSAFDIPFKDKFFDLVFTSGVLIHISPKDIKKAIKEIYRVSKKYIWGFEYFSDTHKEIKYRGNANRLWKGDFAKLYLRQFPNLKLVKELKYKYKNDSNVDSMFLLKKT